VHQLVHQKRRPDHITGAFQQQNHFFFWQ
jgi:hypothetical protein